MLGGGAMKIELQVCSLREDGVDAFLVSGARTEFQKTEYTEQIVGRGGIAARFDEVTVEKPAGGRTAYFQQVDVHALRRNALVLGKLKASILKAREIAFTIMNSGLVFPPYQWKGGRPPVEPPKPPVAFDQRKLRASLAMFVDEIHSQKYDKPVVENPDVTELFSHILYRSCAALARSTIYLKPYVEIRGFTPAAKPALLSRAAFAKPRGRAELWFGETNCNATPKGEAWDRIANLTDLRAMLEQYASELWTGRHLFARADDPWDLQRVFKEKTNRFDAGLPHLNLDHFARHYAGQKQVDPRDLPGGGSLFWTYIHETTHAFADTPDGIYLGTSEDTIKYRDQDPAPHAAHLVFAADVTTYALLRLAGGLAGNQFRTDLLI
jgi:hypothetical protein